MAVTMRTGASSLTRRRFLTTAASSAAITAVGGIAKPYLSRAADRPLITHGIQSGDVSVDSGVVWARADRPARMLVEVATTDSFKNVRSSMFVDALPETDFTAKALVEGLPGGQDMFYRVRFQDHSFPGALSEPQVGRFRTAPTERRSISFVWSGDTGAWGIDEARGGMRTYSTMLQCRPDFFIHSGDHIYADCPFPAERKLPNGEIWKNFVSEEKSKVAQTLADFRGNYKYNLTDRNLRAFNAEVPMFAQWDDHEVTNDWCPNVALGWDGYADKSVLKLSARGCRAFHEFMPMRETLAEAGRIYRKVPYGPLLDVFMLDMRTYKDPNGTDVYADQTIGMLGSAQRAWLKRELAASRATWKVIANDLPLGLVVPDAPGTFEGVSQGDNGKPLGRELEFAEILRFAHHRAIGGIVFLTADVHYTSAHHYDPARAAIGDFTPFWEFVSGPLNAGAFGPNALDTTFGPQTVFAAAPPAANTSPADGFQFFGHVAIDGHSEVMTVTLYDLDGKSLFSTQLTP